MGGHNRGRKSERLTTDQMRNLDIRRIQQDGMLRPGLSFDWIWTSKIKPAAINMAVGANHVVLRYQQSWYGSEWHRCVNHIRFTWTNCNFGGRRAWWACPKCERRVALLYSGQGGYACRNCNQLAYESQRESAEDAAGRRADKLRKRLGWPPGIFNPAGGKPKGMHWRTYFRLRAQHDNHANTVLRGIASTFGMNIDRAI